MRDSTLPRLNAADIMTRQVISVQSDTQLGEIVQILEQHDFDGVPVTDKTGVLIGIITQYELVTKSSGMHIPTIVELGEKLNVLKSEKILIKEQFDAINRMTAQDIMNPEPLTVNVNAPLEEVSRLFSEHHRVNPIPVINDDRLLVGIISRYDIIKLFNIQNFHLSVQTAQKRQDKGKTSGAAETQTEKALKVLGKRFVLVSKWRTSFWYGIAIVTFIIGFFVSIALLLRFNQEPLYPEVKLTYPEQLESNK